MKKLTGWLILLGVFLALAAVAYASDIPWLQFRYEGKSYTVEQASSQDTGFPYAVTEKSGTITLKSIAPEVSLSITAKTADTKVLDTLREYYNLPEASEEEIFSKYVDLKKSYIPAMKDLYKTSYLYGYAGGKLPEANMKLFFEGTEKIFGLNSFIYLYNQSETSLQGTKEETTIDLLIPVAGQRKIISLRAVIPLGKLDKQTADAFTALLGCLEFSELPTQTEPLAVFEKADILAQANAGIYPGVEKDTGFRATYEDRKAGYRIQHSSALVPYVSNAITEGFQYTSFKLDADTVISIAVEPAGSLSLKEQAEDLRALYGSRMEVTADGETEMGGKSFYRLQCSIMEEPASNQVNHKEIYWIISGKTLYRFELSRSGTKPSSAAENEFVRLLSSLEFPAEAAITAGESASPTTNPAISSIALPATESTPAEEVTPAVYWNAEEGYRFSYPEDWKLQDISTDIHYDTIKLKHPELSGSIEAVLTEGRLKPGLTQDEVAEYLTNLTNTGNSPSLLLHYAPPYLGTQARLLHSRMEKRGNALYLYKLINYLDARDQGKLCYVVDAIRNSKVVTLSLIISDQAVSSGNLEHPGIREALDLLATSFTLLDTPQLLDRQKKGEDRNRKVVFLEEFLRKSLGGKAVVEFAINAASGEFVHVAVSHTNADGFYKMKLDYGKKQAVIAGRILYSDILEIEWKKLQSMYKGKTILRKQLDHKALTLTVEYRDHDKQPVRKSLYQIKTRLTPEGPQWETVKKIPETLSLRYCNPLFRFSYYFLFPWVLAR